MATNLTKMLNEIMSINKNKPAVVTPTTTPVRNYNLIPSLTKPELPNVKTNPADLFGANKPLVYTAPSTSNRNNDLTMPTSDHTTLTKIPGSLTYEPPKDRGLGLGGPATIGTTNGTANIVGRPREETQYVSNPVPESRQPGYGVSDAGGIANAGGVRSHYGSGSAGGVTPGSAGTAGGITGGQFQGYDMGQYKPVYPAPPPPPDPYTPPAYPSTVYTQVPPVQTTVQPGTYRTEDIAHTNVGDGGRGYSNVSTAYVDPATGVPTSPGGGRDGTYQQPTIPVAPPTASNLGGGRSSDKKVKENISSKDDNIKKFLDALKAYTYDYKEPEKPGRGQGKQLSVMAQDLMKSNIGKKAVSPDEEGTLTVDYHQLAAPMLGAISYMNDRINKLDKGNK